MPVEGSVMAERSCACRCLVVVVVSQLVLAMTLSCDSATERVRIVAGGGIVASWAQSPDEETVVAPVHLVHEIPARNDDGSVNAVIEIPAGTTAKFEVDKASGALKWEYRDGRPRVIDFLGYPANYGLVPSTLLAENKGAMVILWMSW